MIQLFRVARILSEISGTARILSMISKAVGILNRILNNCRMKVFLHGDSAIIA